MKMRYIGAAAVLFAGPMIVTFASAHVTAQPNEAGADSYFVTAFSVPHGCDGSATIAVRMKIPDGVTSVKPQMKVGWEISIKTKNLDKPAAAGHGATVGETVDEVAWRGGPLPDSLFDTFGLLMKLPDAPGQTLYFPVIQECQQGVHRWIEIPTGQQTWGDLREPAPFLRLKPKTP
ncbi:MAG TPA: YcnI family protein [Pseudomonadota bacterium]|nr:YcnI family protein [Pseudomonadota bacterium]